MSVYGHPSPIAQVAFAVILTPSVHTYGTTIAVEEAKFALLCAQLSQCWLLGVARSQKGVQGERLAFPCRKTRKSESEN